VAAASLAAGDHYDGRVHHAHLDGRAHVLCPDVRAPHLKEHDSENWESVFGNDHAPQKLELL